MFYKPSFCSHCGEKVERQVWMPWTSRRFCDICETELAHHDWLPRGIAVLIAAMFLFSMGVLLRNSENTLPQKVEVRSPEISTAALSNRELTIASDNQARANQLNSAITRPQTDNRALSLKSSSQVSATANRAQSTSDKDVVHYCGARTRKGTPCTRRVKSGERCWQHLGLVSMSESEKSGAIAMK